MNTEEDDESVTLIDESLQLNTVKDNILCNAKGLIIKKKYLKNGLV